MDNPDPRTRCHWLADALQALRAERDENTQRLAFKPSEAISHGLALEKLERRAAKARKRQAGIVNLPTVVSVL
jgi:hypothetical protein